MIQLHDDGMVGEDVGVTCCCCGNGALFLPLLITQVEDEDEEREEEEVAEGHGREDIDAHFRSETCACGRAKGGAGGVV